MNKRITFQGRRRSQAGAAIIEFAVVIPLLLITVLGSVDIGRAIYEAIALSSAAHAGAQYGGISFANSGNTASIRQAVLRNLEDSFGFRAGGEAAASMNAPGAGLGNLASDDAGGEEGGVRITVNRRCACGDGKSDGQTIGCAIKTCPFIGSAPRVYVRVTVASKFYTLVPYPGLPSSIEISRAAEIRAK